MTESGRNRAISAGFIMVNGGIGVVTSFSAFADKYRNLSSVG